MLLEAFLRHVDAAEEYRAVLDKEGRTASPRSREFCMRTRS
jgi:hypothetical protein